MGKGEVDSFSMAGGAPDSRSEKWNEDSNINWAGSECEIPCCPWTTPEDLKGNTRRKAKAGVSEKTGFKSQLYHLINGLEQAT